MQPVSDLVHYQAPPLVIDENADLEVRAWRWSYNARGIIEIPNRLRAYDTAIVVVHPWGVDDGQGWKTPQPAGAADFCTLAKNALSHEHVIQELEAKLKSFDYNAGALPKTLALSKTLPVIDYFRQFRGLDAGAHYNGAGFWSLPIPVLKSLHTSPNDVVIYDGEGYPAMRDFLKKHKIRHVLLTGYCTDMCFKGTTAGYTNLRKDFNVFLVGDATLATFPANSTPAYATNASLSLASMENLGTQVSWIKLSKSK